MLDTNISPFYPTRSSSRGVLTYGLGALYLTTISSSSQSIYVLPADFASFATIVSDSVKPAFGVIPQTDVVRDIRVMSQLLQPLPGESTLYSFLAKYAEYYMQLHYLLLS